MTGEDDSLSEEMVRKAVDQSQSGAPAAGSAVRDRFSADEIFQHVVTAAAEEVNLGLRELFFSGLAAGFAIEMLSNLERAMEHEDRTLELVEILSTQKVRLDYRIEADLVINGDER